LVTYSPGSNVRRASYTIYKFYSKSFLNYIGHPAKLKKRVKIKIYIKYIRDRRYVPKKGAMPSGGFRNKYVYAEVTGRIDIKDQKSFTPEKKNKTTYKKMNKTLTLVIRLNRVKINSDGYYLYKAGNPYRRRARFKRYLFSKNNYRKFIKSGRKKPVKVQIKIFKVKIHTWYPKNPRANYPIGGFKTFFYYARILKVK
jgi:hypothetical protein